MSEPEDHGSPERLTPYVRAGGSDPAGASAGAERPPVDPVAAAAVVSGLIGIVVFGLLLALITGVLASWAGQRAREDGRSMDNATIALGLAVLDGLVWLVLHFVFDLTFVAG